VFTATSSFIKQVSFSGYISSQPLITTHETVRYVQLYAIVNSK